MLTVGRLAGGILFALFGWYIGGLLPPFFPEERMPDFVIPMCIVIGLYLGWRVCGTRLGRGYVEAVNTGLTTALSFSVSVLFGIAFMAMIKNAMRNRYDGPMDALADTFGLMWERAQDFFDFGLIMNVVLVGILCALIAEYFGRRYP